MRKNIILLATAGIAAMPVAAASAAPGYFARTNIPVQANVPEDPNAPAMAPAMPPTENADHLIQVLETLIKARQKFYAATGLNPGNLTELIPLYLDRMPQVGPGITIDTNPNVWYYRGASQVPIVSMTGLTPTLCQEVNTKLGIGVTPAANSPTTTPSPETACHTEGAATRFYKKVFAAPVASDLLSATTAFKAEAHRTYELTNSLASSGTDVFAGPNWYDTWRNRPRVGGHLVKQIAVSGYRVSGREYDERSVVLSNLEAATCGQVNQSLGLGTTAIVAVRTALPAEKGCYQFGSTYSFVEILAPEIGERVIWLGEAMKTAFLARAASVGASNVPTQLRTDTIIANPKVGFGSYMQGWTVYAPVYGYGVYLDVMAHTCRDINSRLGLGNVVATYSAGQKEGCFQNGSRTTYIKMFY